MVTVGGGGGRVSSEEVSPFLVRLVPEFGLLVPGVAVFSNISTVWCIVEL